MRLCLVEDHAVAGLEPLTLTRPAFELRLGAKTIGRKIAEAFAPHLDGRPDAQGVVVRSHLKAPQRERDPNTAVNDPDWLAQGPTLVARARWVPPAAFAREYDQAAGLRFNAWIEGGIQ